MVGFGAVACGGGFEEVLAEVVAWGGNDPDVGVGVREEGCRVSVWVEPVGYRVIGRVMERVGAHT